MKSFSKTMITIRLLMTGNHLNYIRLLNNIQRIKVCQSHRGLYSTFTLDAFTSDLLERHRNKNRCDVSEVCVQHCTTSAKDNIFKLSNIELDNMFTELLTNNRDKQIDALIAQCQNCAKYITFVSLIKLYKHYSQNGNPDMIIKLQNYCAKIDYKFFLRNGEFQHYLGKAECMRGNSDIGLSILKTSYCKYESLRSLYRLILRDLIQDSVLNRSEATLIVFKKYVFEFSEECSDHYPLVCFWHICWASSWFSDQMLSNELLEASENLQEIVKDKASALSINVLKDYNEDAVVRLLQILLKYDMMTEYVAVLEVLFNYKLRNRDIRGCTEIIKNCEVLGVSLPSNQQGRYITMIIKGKRHVPEELPAKPRFKDFKLKF